jgi:hypothetical protein
MLILTALLVPALVVVGALAFGVTALWTGHQDAQRAVDLGALSAAASSPTVSTDFPIAGVGQRCQELMAPVDGSNWQDRGRDIVQRQLTGGLSPVATAFETDTAAPMVCVTRQWESPLLAALDACARDVAELAGCRSRLEDELRADLPAVNALDASAWSAIEQAHALLDPVDKLLTPEVSTQLGDACASETFVGVLGVGWICDHRVGELLDAVDQRTGTLLSTADATVRLLAAPLSNAVQSGWLNPVGRGVGMVDNRLAQVGVDLAGVSPALLTPRVQIDLGDFEVKPAFSPMTFDITTSATARRVIKSALVLPSVGIPGGAWEMLPQSTKDALLAKLGPDGAGLMTRAGEDGWVVDPNILTHSVRETADHTLDAFDKVQRIASAEMSKALCASLAEHNVACPVGDRIVNQQHLFGPFMEDVWDATQPPPDTTPTVQEILARHADTHEPLTMIGGERMIRLGELFGEGVWTTIKSGNVTPDLRPLLSELMFVPALDVVPAAVFRDGSTFRIQRLTETTGLYKARLVK